MVSKIEEQCEATLAAHGVTFRCDMPRDHDGSDHAAVLADGEPNGELIWPNIREDLQQAVDSRGWLGWTDEHEGHQRLYYVPPDETPTNPGARPVYV